MRNHKTVVMVDNKYAYRELNIFEGENKNGECVDVELSRINAEGSSVMNSWIKTATFLRRCRHGGALPSMSQIKTVIATVDTIRKSFRSHTRSTLIGYLREQKKTE